MKIRTADHSDIDSVLQVYREAFDEEEREGVVGLVNELLGSDDSGQVMHLVAEKVANSSVMLALVRSTRKLEGSHLASF